MYYGRFLVSSQLMARHTMDRVLLHNQVVYIGIEGWIRGGSTGRAAGQYAQCL